MDKGIKKLQSVHLHPTTPLRLLVWRLRRLLRDAMGRDILDNSSGGSPSRQKLRRIYLRTDALMVKHLPRLARSTPRAVAMKRVREALQLELGYKFYDVDIKRPWGGYFRIVDAQTDKFLRDFFPGLSPRDARMGVRDVELSPKIMVLLPGRRFSWQYHDRRAERWHFLTDCLYYRSSDDTLPKATHAKPGDSVQFAQGERHRAAAPKGGYALIAEIWQHSDADRPSNESDVVRLEDDFNRPKRPRSS